MKITAYQVLKLKEMTEAIEKEFAAIKKMHADGNDVPTKRVVKLDRAVKKAGVLAAACEKAVQRGEISNAVLLTPSSERKQ